MHKSNTLLQLITDYCSALQNVNQEFPFGNDVLVFKTAGKMFALLHLADPLRLNLKCDPLYAQLIRDKFESVTPGYHMNKKHWNTIHLDGTVEKEQIFEWILDSYNLVARKKNNAP